MKLSELTKGEKALIVKIDTDDSLRDRLFSFGISKGSELYIENCSLAKQTISIEVEGTKVGLRVNEASQIQVEKI